MRPTNSKLHPKSYSSMTHAATHSTAILQAADRSALHILIIVELRGGFSANSQKLAEAAMKSGVRRQCGTTGGHPATRPEPRSTLHLQAMLAMTYATSI